MKYFGKKNNILKMIIIGGFILLILALGFWLKDKKHKDLITEKTWQITEFIENIPAESNHEEFYFANNYVSIIINQDGRYISHIFDCQRGQEIDFMTLVTDKKAFMEKITQLLYLKYPSFIADVLKTNAKTYNLLLRL